MSQSDYIRFKKISTELKEISKLDSVLDANDYTIFKQYTLENQIKNTKPILNQLVIPKKQIIFDMEMNTVFCPIMKFNICKNTNKRENRVLLTENSCSLTNRHPEKRVIYITNS